MESSHYDFKDSSRSHGGSNIAERETMASLDGRLRLVVAKGINREGSHTLLQSSLFLRIPVRLGGGTETFRRLFHGSGVILMK